MLPHNFTIHDGQEPLTVRIADKTLIHAASRRQLSRVNKLLPAAAGGWRGELKDEHWPGGRGIRKDMKTVYNTPIIKCIKNLHRVNN